MSEPFLAQIVMFGGNFAPRGWAFCDGQLLAVSSYSALFSILGTTYGGDGRTTFGLPDLRGRVPMHPGNGPALSSRRLGEAGGAESHTLTSAQLPSHSHSLNASSAQGDRPSPVGNRLAAFGTTAPMLGSYSGGAPDAALASDSVGSTGGGQAVSHLPPFRCVNFIIALQGTYPSRS